MSKEIPILFSTPMVQAILDGRKTMTRRIVKPQPDKKADIFSFQPVDWPKKPWTAKYELNDPLPRYEITDSYKCPYGKPGDILWVRETWQEYGGNIFYKADGEKNDGPLGCANKWKPSIFLKKEDARIWLEITEVKVERLQSISKHDATYEGVEKDWDGTSHWYKNYLGDGINVREWSRSPVASFKSLWDKINGEESWKANPWVWVVSFKVLSTTGKP